MPVVALLGGALLISLAIGAISLLAIVAFWVGVAALVAWLLYRVILFFYELRLENSRAREARKQQLEREQQEHIRLIEDRKKAQDALEVFKRRRESVRVEIESILDNLFPSGQLFKIACAADHLSSAQFQPIYERLRGLERVRRFGNVQPGITLTHHPDFLPATVADSDKSVREFIDTCVADNTIRHMLVAPRNFDIPEDARFEHQWVVGAHGSGKTTYLSAWIQRDLLRVARNECSLLVMDSQNEIIPQLASLDVFSSDGPLAGRLMYLEVHPDYPLALNIFDSPGSRLDEFDSQSRVMLQRSSLQLIRFFLNGILKAEMSSHMDTLLNYVLQGVMSVPGATIGTMQDVLAGKRVQYGPLSPRVREWLDTKLMSGDWKLTRTALANRLDGFTADPLFGDMFCAPRNQIDLFGAFQSAKVVLINTNKALLRDATEPFGRFFIAKVLQATEERMLLPKASRLPVYCYIDECTDYIADEEKVAELIDKARKQNVSFTFANQRPEQVRSTNVLSALRNCSIQAFNGTRGTYDIALRGSLPVTVTVPDIRFDTLPTMSAAEREAMRTHMRARYCGSPQSPPSVPPSSSNGGTPAQPPDIEADLRKLASRTRQSPPDDDLSTGPEKY
jgi:hypothetical protein